MVNIQIHNVDKIRWVTDVDSDAYRTLRAILADGSVQEVTFFKKREPTDEVEE